MTAPLISVIIPTRERAAYLEHAIRTCTDNPSRNVEILVLDNASTDDTAAVVDKVLDPRVRYVRNSSRLSMRDNFEKGIGESRGEILGFIGDDDGILPDTIDKVLALFQDSHVDAVSAARAHYFWPDLLAARKNTALLPRGVGVKVKDSRVELRHVLADSDYYRLPCLYHGFVRRAIVNRVADRQGRFFLSSQVDMYSSIALSMEGIRYAFSQAPLVINGGSSRSNGAAHFGGGAQQEKTLWKKEDDIGFLPGFADTLTIGSLIIESALRYVQAAHDAKLSDVLDMDACRDTLEIERLQRLRAGRSASDAIEPFATAGIESRSGSGIGSDSIHASRAIRLVRSFLRNRPVDMSACGVANVHQAARALATLASSGRTGLFDEPLQQFRAAARIARK